MTRRGIPLASMEVLLKKAGAPRVSDKAKEVLRAIIEEKGHEIGTRAIRFANHAGRKTVKAGDVKLAEK